MPEYHNPLDTVDFIIQKGDEIVLIRRKNDPFKNQWAIPGGFVAEESVEETAVREAKEETGLDVRPVDILGVYSVPGRDPRGHSITTTFICEVVDGEISGGDDAADARWFRIDDAEKEDLGFDHNKMLKDYVKWRKEKGTYWSTRSS